MQMVCLLLRPRRPSTSAGTTRLSNDEKLSQLNWRSSAITAPITMPRMTDVGSSEMYWRPIQIRNTNNTSAPTSAIAIQTFNNNDLDRRLFDRFVSG